MDKNNMKEIFSDKDFIKELLSLEDTAAVMAALKAKGLDLSEEEVLAVRDLLAKIKSGEITAEDLKQMESGQIPDSMLDLVSGGSIVFGVMLGLGIGSALSAAVNLATKEDNQSGATAHGSGASGGW